jgi:gas vesicle protein
MDNKPSTLSRTRSVGPNGGEDPAKLRAEIAETRNEMSGTIEELHGRLNPVVLKDQALDQFHEATETIKKELNERLQDAKETLMAEFKDARETVRDDVLDEIDTVKAKLRDEIARTKAAIREATIGKVENMMRGVKDVVADNPIPAALAGVGLAWLFLQGRRRRPSRLPEGARPQRRMISGEGLDEAEAEAEWRPSMSTGEGAQAEEGRSIGRQIRDVGQKAGQKVADATKEAASAVSHVAHEAKDSVSDVAQRTGSKASELSRGAGHQLRRVQRSSGELYRANPIAVGTALLAAGTLVGLAMPRTKVENEWLGEARDEVVDKAQDLAHQALGKADEAVQRIGDAGESQVETSARKPGDEYH